MKLVRPKQTGLKAGLLERRRHRLAHLARIEYDGQWWAITADATGVEVRRWHAPATSKPRRVFTFETLVKNTIGSLLTVPPKPGTVARTG